MAADFPVRRQRADGGRACNESDAQPGRTPGDSGSLIAAAGTAGLQRQLIRSGAVVALAAACDGVESALPAFPAGFIRGVDRDRDQRMTRGKDCADEGDHKQEGDGTIPVHFDIATLCNRESDRYEI